MNINMTFVIQMIAFGIFVFICMRFLWPEILKTISERQKEIQGIFHNNHSDYCCRTFIRIIWQCNTSVILQYRESCCQISGIL